MKNDKLTGIERDLVLKYLIDGNIPVTVTPVEDSRDNDNIHSISSQIFPVALKGEHLKVEKNGKIQLLKPNKAVYDFIGKKVKVEFYFNRVGLYFYSQVLQKNEELSILVPDELHRIQDTVDETSYDFSALLYFDCKNKANISIRSIPWAHSEIFTRPVWKSIPLENQQAAKSYLEGFVEEAKTEGKIGNGIQLIPICNYLTYNESERIEALQDRKKLLSILYVDHERIVFGADKGAEDIHLNDEYGIKLSFSLKNSPILSRDIFATCKVNKVYTDVINTKVCFDCTYDSIQEEDLRFIYEKATKLLFI